MLSAPVQHDLWGNPVEKRKKRRSSKLDSSSDSIVDMVGESSGGAVEIEINGNGVGVQLAVTPVVEEKPWSPYYIPPRYYQGLAVESVIRSLQESTSTLMIMATGTGKTPTAGFVLKHFLDTNLDKDVLAIAHRQELIEQMYDTFRSVCWPYTVGREIASEYTSTGNDRPRVVVASKDTLWKDRRLQRFAKERFGLIFIDEAHHYAKKNKTYHNIIQYFSGFKLFGATATPDRSDGYALGLTFESVSYVFDIYDAIIDGWLVRPEQELVTIQGYDISHIPTTTEEHELNASEVALVLEKNLPLIGVANAAAEASNRDGQKRQTIIFCQSVKQSKNIAALLNHKHEREETGVAASIDEKTDRELRKEIVAMYKRGEIRYLVNYGIFTEGFDTDTTEVIVIARPVKSRSLYAQMLGRGTRPLRCVIDALASSTGAEERKKIIAASAKTKCTVIDLVGVTGQHKLVTVVDILGGEINQSLYDVIKKRIEEGEKDVLQVLEEEEKKAIETESLRGCVVSSTMARRFVDPFDSFDAGLIREPVSYNNRPPTEEQLTKLRKHGMRKKDEKKMTFWRAEKLIQSIGERRKNNLCTVKQARILERYGENPNVSYDEAMRVIDKIAASGWKPLHAQAT